MLLVSSFLKVKPESRGEQGVCNLLSVCVCVWYTLLITSAVIGLFPLTLTEGEMSHRRRDVSEV